VPIDYTLSHQPPAAWADVIDQVVLPGSLFTEVDFFHRPSRTLILTDLIQNFEADRIRGRFYRWIVKLAGVTDPDGEAPIDMQLSFFHQRKAVWAAALKMVMFSHSAANLASSFVAFIISISGRPLMAGPPRRRYDRHSGGPDLRLLRIIASIARAPSRGCARREGAKRASCVPSDM
jgi:hypothetical protein